MTFLSMLFLLSLHGFGYVLVALLRIPASSVRCASTYLIGSFVASLLFFVALVGGFDIYRSLGLILSVVVPSALYAWTSKGYWIEISAMVHSFLPRNRTEQSLFILITSILCYVILMNAFWPQTDWDAITLYDFRARLLLMVGSIRPLFSSIQDIYLLSYPWYTSVLLAMQYLLGAWNGMGIFSLLAVSLVLTFFSLISSTLGRLPAFFGSLALLTVPMLFAHTMIAYTNFPYMVYWGLGICCLLSWIFSKKIEMAQLGSLLIAGSLWVRQSEPFWIIAVMLLLYGCITLRQWKVSLWLLPIIIVWRGWNNYVHSILKQVLPQNSIELATYEQGGNMLSSIQSFLDFHRWLEVLEHLARYATPIWGGWIVIIIFLILRQRRTHHRIVATITTFACIGAIVAGTYLFANNTYWKEIVDSFQRLLLFAFPVFIYSVLALVDNKETTYD